MENLKIIKYYAIPLSIKPKICYKNTLVLVKIPVVWTANEVLRTRLLFYVDVVFVVRFPN